MLKSLRVLGPGDPRFVSRHRTLRATFDWTHGLLSPTEQRLLRRLAVFVGGCTLGLAQQVAADGEAAADAGAESDGLDCWGVLDGLDALIDQSLVVADGADPPRYRLLEVTRAYALEKLADAGEAHALHARHAHAVWRLYADAEVAKNEQIRGALNMAEFLQRLAPELDNLRAARLEQAIRRPVGGDRDRRSSSEALRMFGLSAEALLAMQPFATRSDDRVAPETAELFFTGLCAVGTHGRVPAAEMQYLIDAASGIYRRVGSPRRLHLGLYRKGFALLHMVAVTRGSAWPPKWSVWKGRTGRPSPWRNGSISRPAWTPGWAIRSVDRRLHPRGGLASVRTRRKRFRAEHVGEHVPVGAVHAAA